MPQRAPGRLGCATFPLVREFSFPAASPENSFALMVQPSLETPLRISRLAPVPLSIQPINGVAQHISGEDFLQGTHPCAVVGVPLADQNGLSLSSCPISTSANPAFTFSANVTTPQRVNVKMYHLQVPSASSWTAVVDFDIGGSHDDSDSAAIFFGTVMTAYSVVITPHNDINSISVVNYSITPTGGSTVSCGPAYDEAVMDTYKPLWDTLLNASKFAKVVACDVLVTYEGSTLDNSGSIAAANVDDDLVVGTGGTLYDTIASLPFDKYRGRLASEGQTQGGAHWHFVPSQQSQLEPSMPVDDNIPIGFIAINGIANEQVVRIECHYTINFYSQDPSYKMLIPPPATGLSLLLWHLRAEVPLVTSNDSHIFKKMKSAAKRGAQLANSAFQVATSPQAISAMEMLLELAL
jgi:hypothetical protein